MPKNYINCSQLDEIDAPQAIQKIAIQLKKQGIKKRNIKQIQYTDTIHSAQTARLEIVPENSDNFASIKISTLPFSGSTDSSTTAFLFSNQLTNQENYIRFLEFASPEICLDVSRQIGSHITKHTKGIILVTPEPDFVRKLNFHKPLSIPVVAIHPRDYTIISRWQQLESLLATLSVTTQQEVVQRESLRVVFKGKTDEKIIVMAANSGSSVSYDALLLAQVATIMKKKSAKTRKTIELVFAQSAPNSNYWLKSLQSITSSQDFVVIILENTIHFSGWNAMGREDVEKFFQVYSSENSAIHSYPVYCGNYREVIENGLPVIMHNGANALQPCCPSCTYISPAQNTYELATYIAQLLEKMAQDDKPLPKRLSQAEIQHFLLQHQLSEKLAFKK